MINEPPSKAWVVVIVAIIGAVGVIIAAIIGLGMPFAERIADRYFPQLIPTSIIYSQTQTYPQQEVTQASSNPVTPPALSTRPPSIEFVRREATGGYVTQTYNISLSDGEVIVGQGYGFQQQTGGCIAYIVKGSGDFTFSVTDGAWLYYRNVTTTEQIELLLQNQIDSLSQYGCSPSKVKIVRLP